MMKRLGLFLASAALTAGSLLAVVGGVETAVNALGPAAAPTCTMLVDSQACLDTSHIDDVRPAGPLSRA